ncbi:putative HIT finger domain protein [Aspergillus heteromorphus CBS 117.55]|uniref:Putative HIT finger domain protein n=1 Tax=Aspergillus heteromorphus CBS 117.55 TaxID=1448321 RepID=A0A317VA57_9EURO|nr:putative HIT finger domain protein [Aspergillus heteromorphus CBS 117.55]PWY70955.1 putative HIT finger domain protein [Aspergillus heteromorphus CBS 117.55]
MYRVELLPTGSTTHLTPGWTYVPDRGFDPAKAAITPAIGRKRGIRDPGRADLSSRQNNAIVRHLAELDRENHHDLQIPIPTKGKDAARGSRGKVTSNVRRILQSQKTFRNYLDDEEAALAQQASTTVPGTSSAQQSATASTSTPSHRASLSKITKPGTTTTTSSFSSLQTLHRTRNSSAILLPRLDSNNPRRRRHVHGHHHHHHLPQNPNELIKTPHDNDPLLKSYLPPAPSDRIMQMLLAEPPLTYNASRAGAPMSRRSPRYFCCMCGYWGKIRCKNCHLRTCGLDCYKVHEDSRCGAFF